MELFFRSAEMVRNNFAMSENISNHIKDENHFQTDHSADCRDDDSLQCHSRQQQES
jgi:hypothetical protein